MGSPRVASGAPLATRGTTARTPTHVANASWSCSRTVPTRRGEWDAPRSPATPRWRGTSSGAAASGAAFGSAGEFGAAGGGTGEAGNRQSTPGLMLGPVVGSSTGAPRAGVRMQAAGPAGSTVATNGRTRSASSVFNQAGKKPQAKRIIHEAAPGKNDDMIKLLKLQAGGCQRQCDDEGAHRATRHRCDEERRRGSD